MADQETESSEPAAREYAWQGRQFSQEVVAVAENGLRK